MDVLRQKRAEEEETHRQELKARWEAERRAEAEARAKEMEVSVAGVTWQPLQAPLGLLIRS